MPEKRGQVMVTPLEVMVKMQLAMCEGWAKLMIETFTGYERIFEQQAKLFEHPRFLRLQDKIPQGADWSENYGKRNHDVNVERV